MLKEKLKSYNIFLGSASSRRKKLLEDLNITFSIRKTQKEEKYPINLQKSEIAKFLARQKANFIYKQLSDNYLLITADTIVVQNNEVLHKPKDKEEAIKILQMLSGKTHKVISGVCIKTNLKEIVFSELTEVSFNKLSKEEITYYIDHFNPFDKAGSYGIQEWIGYIGIKGIKGSYNNVIGLPTTALYQKLKLFT